MARGAALLAGVAFVAALFVVFYLTVVVPDEPPQWETADEKWMAVECPVVTHEVDGQRHYEQAVLRVPEEPDLPWFRHNDQKGLLTVGSEPLPAGQLVCVSWRSPLTTRYTATDSMADAEQVTLAVAWWPDRPYHAQYVCLRGPGCTPILPDTAVGGVSEGADGHSALTLDTRFDPDHP